MKLSAKEKLEGYYQAADSWAQDRLVARERSRRAAWIVAAIAGGVALLEAVALILLTPLKREVPYTLLVDKQTGYVEALKPLDQQTIAPDKALTRSFLVQYVIARESFDVDTLKQNYRKVAIWSAGEARDRYISAMKADTPESPLATLSRSTTIDVRIRSVSALSARTMLVRFDTLRSEKGYGQEVTDHWAAVIKYRYSTAQMSAEDRFINPLGFQVTSYHKDIETPPATEENRAAPPPAGVQGK
jgi:Type IV secretory pathway, component VirB8